MKKLIVGILAALLLVTGCANQGLFTPPAECVDAQSVILEKFPNPIGLDKALLGVQLVALSEIEGYTKEDAIAVLDDLQAFLKGGITYADAVELIQSKLNMANSLAGGAIFIVGVDISVLSTGITVSECDLKLIDMHIERQKLLIQIYSEG